MGNSGWDDDSWRRSRSPHGRPPDAPTTRGRDRDHASSSSRGNGWGDEGRPGSSSRRGGSGSSGSSYDRPSSRSRPMGRDEYANGRSAGGSMRGPRPPSRDDGYGPPRHRHRPDGPPGGSSGRNRPSERGGLWGDDGARPRRPGPGAGVALGTRGGARPGPRDPRDPRLARRPMGGMAADEDDEDESSFGLGKALLAIVMMFAVGAVAGFGYFRLSAPKVNAGDNNTAPQISTPATSTGTPATGTPSTTPSATATPQADVGPSAMPIAVVSSGASRTYVIVVRTMG